MGLKKSSWAADCQIVVDMFERDQYNHAIGQFFHIKQFWYVVEYVELFYELVHQLLDPNP